MSIKTDQSKIQIHWTDLSGWIIISFNNNKFCIFDIGLWYMYYVLICIEIDMYYVALVLALYNS